MGWVTPQSIQRFANLNLSQTAQDLETGAQGNVQTITHGGTVLFTYGKAAPNHPVNTTGIDLHTATGKTRMRADSGALTMHAQKSVTISSQTTIKADSPQKILLSAGGSSITIQGGQILLQAGGAINLKGNTKSYTGPASASATALSLPKNAMAISPNEPIYSQQFDLSHLALNDELGYSSEKLPYRVFDKSGKFIVAGHTDQDGLTDRILTNSETELIVLVGYGGWRVEEYFEEDEATEEANEAGDNA